jgi:lysophospholipase L1-like esterase
MWLGACGGNSPEGSTADPGAIAAQVRIVGRTQASSEGTTFSLAGTTLRFHFQGTGLAVHLVEKSLGQDDTGAPFTDAYQVYLDGERQGVLTAPSGEATYQVVKDLPQGEHTVTLVKRTESLVGEGTLVGAQVEGGALLDPPAPSERRIEFIGDATESGYGIEGTSAHCKFSSATENHDLSYPALTARALEAEEITVSHSGKGVVRNFDGTTDETLPSLYGRAVLTEANSRWNFGEWKPQVVVIDLGANDYFAGVEDDAAFVASYENFVRSVRTHYADAELFVTLGPLLSDTYPKGEDARTRARAALQQAVSELTDAGDARIHFLELPEPGEHQVGCDYHPDADAHAELAAQVTQAIQAVTGW